MKKKNTEGESRYSFISIFAVRRDSGSSTGERDWGARIPCRKAHPEPLRLRRKGDDKAPKTVRHY